MAEQDQQVNAVDDLMQGWSQVDIVPASAVPFVHLADLTCPLTTQARELAAADPQATDPLGIVETEIETGFVVLTQTCDIVRRPCTDRPYLELAVLEVATPDKMREVEKATTPRYALVPAVAADRLVADLSRTVTVEKAVLAAIPADRRVQGCRNDAERQRFAAALAREHNRFAFPDAFNEAMGRIVDRIRKGHGRESPRGEALALLREIRVECAPDWASPEELTVLFVFDTAVGIPQDVDTIVAQIMEQWVDRPPFVAPSIAVVGLDQMTAARYLASQPLDFDYLSSSGAGRIERTVEQEATSNV